MALTHEQIAAMTCGEVNKEIAKRLDQYEEWDSMGSDNMDCPDVFEEYPDYCHDWSHAGRLLEMMTEDENHYDAPILRRSRTEEWQCFTLTTLSHKSKSAPEAISRCWLEWYDATHEATP